MHTKSNKAFTLIELLTVIAIIGILAAILIPTLGAARTAALKSKTKVQFSQWAVALQMFKTEYGYFPDIASSGKLVPASFFAALTTKTYDGKTPSDYKGNTKKLSFYSASDSEISLKANGDKTDGDLKDAFGNTDIAVFYDTDGDGIVKAADGLTKAKVTSIDGVVCDPAFATKTIDTANGVRAGVIFYSAGKGGSSNDIVYSWQ
jgi:prepilin-type N-terminal cleavage/methylation domain-containing protein